MERQTVCKVLGGVHRTQAHAAGKGGKEKRTVHDGKDTDGSRRSRLLQDTAFQSYSQIINGLKNRCIRGIRPCLRIPFFSWEKAKKLPGSGLPLSSRLPYLPITYPYPYTTSACYGNGRLPYGPETPCRSGNRATTSEPGNGMSGHDRIPSLSCHHPLRWRWHFIPLSYHSLFLLTYWHTVSPT